MNHRLPAVIFLTAAALSAIAALLGGPRESAQAGAVALLALAGWAITRGRGAARGNAAPSLTQTGATINAENLSATAYAVAGSSGPQPWSAAAALFALVGPTLLTVGAAASAGPRSEKSPERSVAPDPTPAGRVRRRNCRS